MLSSSDEETLRSQLHALESQREQLKELLAGADAGSPLLSLQSELTTTIEGIHARLEEKNHGRVPSVNIGDVCWAPRIYDRRRARAIVERVDKSRGTCLVSWQHPRHKREIVCRFWKQAEGCKLAGSDCPFSHGVEVQLSELRQCGGLAPRTPSPGGSGRGVGEGASAEWVASLTTGSRVLAKFHDRVWYAATVEGSAEGSTIAVRFSGYEDTPEIIPAQASHLAPLEDEENVSEGSDESELEDPWADAALPPGVWTGEGEDEGNGGEASFLGVRVLGEGGKKARPAGGELFSDAYVVGEWEQHTKGFGSRILSRMGYRRGEGLGKDKQGMSKPIPLQVLPPGRALDHIRDPAGAGERSSRSIGATGHTKKKKAEATSGHEPQKNMFNFLNVTIHAGAGSSSGFGPTAGSGAGTGAGVKAECFSGKKRASEMTRSELRSHLVRAREAESAFAAKAARLGEVVERNAEKDPKTAREAKRMLVEVQARVEEARASLKHVQAALTGKEERRGAGGKGKKGGMFSF